MRERGDLTCCARCAGAGVAARTARRRLFKSAVFPAPHALRRGPGNPALGAASTGNADPAGLPVTVTGLVLDVSPHVLVVASGSREERFLLSPGTVAWRGSLVEPATLMPGDQVLVRVLPARREVADKIWAGIGRVTGTILERSSEGLLVDEGRTRRRQAVVISPGSVSRIQVRFPRLEPGHLIDVIGVRRGGTLEAMVPATSQPAYRAGQVAGVAFVTGSDPGTISGSATWHEQGGQEEEHGVAYPAIDPEAGCGEPVADGHACADLPLLAVGSMLAVRNECTGRARVLPVTGCGAVARLFCDRCLACGTSPRGRIADLTPASFISLGGELEQGCFNATIAMGQ
jgi:hypothetical protein